MNALNLSSDEFRLLAARVTAMAADFLAQLPSMRSFPEVSGKTTTQQFEGPLATVGLKGQALDALADVIAMSRPPSPRFYGYVLGSGEPVAALADLLVSLLNQNVTAWRSSPAGVSIERQVVRWIATALGCDDFTGSLCGGGSAANLMALAMAREAKLPANDPGARAGTVYASTEAHMSIGKSMALLGLGRANLRLIPTDRQLRMSARQLHSAIAADLSDGRTPVAVIATAGTVSTGAIDPLPQLAAVCRQYGVWLHIDGAYGALAALAIPARFRGLAAADSLSLDPHKWLYQPVDCGLLLYRDAAAAARAFSFTGEYARALQTDPVEGFSFFEESLELSRRFRALKLWLSLRYHGMDAFRAAIRADLRHARSLAGSIKGCADLELLAPAPLSAVCFRYRSREGGAAADAMNAAILRRVNERGRVYLSNALVRGQFALRACFVNHRTTDADVAEIVPEVLSAASDVLRA
jgi:aromatic-L-amino-acid/L-tryptophan decarboxylase